jgi:hypothetical protein
MFGGPDQLEDDVVTTTALIQPTPAHSGTHFVLLNKRSVSHPDLAGVQPEATPNNERIA